MYNPAPFSSLSLSLLQNLSFAVVDTEFFFKNTKRERERERERVRGNTKKTRKQFEVDVCVSSTEMNKHQV
jgi:hypothetical protein